MFASLGYVCRCASAAQRLLGTRHHFLGRWSVRCVAHARTAIGWSTSTRSLSAGSYAWSGLLYQAIGVTVMAYILWYWALGTGGIARVGLFQFLQPLSGVVLAWLVLAENISLIFLYWRRRSSWWGSLLAFRAR